MQFVISSAEQDYQFYININNLFIVHTSKFKKMFNRQFFLEGMQPVGLEKNEIGSNKIL